MNGAVSLCGFCGCRGRRRGSPRHIICATARRPFRSGRDGPAGSVVGPRIRRLLHFPKGPCLFPAGTFYRLIEWGLDGRVIASVRTLSPYGDARKHLKRRGHSARAVMTCTLSRGARLIAIQRQRPASGGRVCAEMGRRLVRTRSQHMTILTTRQINDIFLIFLETAQSRTKVQHVHGGGLQPVS